MNDILTTERRTTGGSNLAVYRSHGEKCRTTGRTAQNTSLT